MSDATPDEGRATPDFSGYSESDAVAELKRLLNAGEAEHARAACAALSRRFPENATIRQTAQKLEQRDHVAAASRRFPGPPYQEWLKWLHTTLKPEGYLEIGVESGASLQMAEAETWSIGIDPQPKIAHQVDTWVKIFAMESDAFFEKHDVVSELGGRSLDLAFIDGLHTFDQALKDFINVEQNAHDGTVVVFHDTYPVTPITASRSRKSIFWLGDTWKVVLILRHYRPDLCVFTIPTYPSGLTVVKNLKPGSCELRSNFQDIVSDWMPLSFTDEQDGLADQLNALANDEASVKARLQDG